MNKSLKTLEKAIDILCLFDPEQEELSAQDIADKLHIPLSTTYRYLQVFVDKQFLSKDELTNRFCLGLTIVKLGLLAVEKISVIQIAHSHLKFLAASCLETAALTVLDGLRLIIVDAIESPRPAKLALGRGSILPLYAAAPGKAVLAYSDHSFIDHVIETTGLVKLGKNTITEPDGLEKELALIRRSGFAESDSEFELGLASVAAPIFDHKGKVIGSIYATGPSARIFENKPEFIEQVMETARKISSELGHGKSSQGAGITSRV